MGKATQEVHVVRLKEGDRAADIVKVHREEKIVEEGKKEE